VGHTVHTRYANGRRDQMHSFEGDAISLHIYKDGHGVWLIGVYMYICIYVMPCTLTSFM
jgi:hypothetical protein